MATKDKTKEVSKAKIVSGRDPRDVILNPRVTEKASFGVAQNAYTFDVNPRSTKTEIKEAIEILYKKTPVKILHIILGLMALHPSVCSRPIYLQSWSSSSIGVWKYI